MTGILTHICRSNGGIPKQVVPGPVMLTPEGVEGDRHRNLKYHGGPDKAVLMIDSDTLDDLRAAGYSVYPGALGENLTVSGLDRSRWRTGQRYSIGDGPIIELTTLRVPCLNLDIYGPPIKKEMYDSACKAGNPDTPRWARGGFYARVIRGGLLVPGAPITLQSEMA